jgi:dTDP-4-dehydrorhamnose reductase
VTRILLLGRTGQVGWELNRSLLPLGEVIALSRAEADFSRPESLRQIVRDVGAQIVVNAVAYTAVDKAESEEAIAHQINADAPAVLAEEVKRSDALLVHYSTDYIFDGTKATPYTEADQPNPINAYGRTKLAGERNILASGCKHLILRTSWVYSSHGKNFVKTILRLAEQQYELRIVADQIGTPTSARFIADVTSGILSRTPALVGKSTRNLNGTYHLTPRNYTSWHGFGQTILDLDNRLFPRSKRLPTLVAIQSFQYPLPAPRPKNSRLNSDKFFNGFKIHQPEWTTSLQLCLDELAKAPP